VTGICIILTGEMKHAGMHMCHVIDSISEIFCEPFASGERLEQQSVADASPENQMLGVFFPCVPYGQVSYANP
jgi:hypothetical protein